MEDPKAATKSCGSCIYIGALGNCRKHAPSPIVMTGSGGVINWPKVDPVNDWCAEGYNATIGWYDGSPAPTGPRVK